MTSFSDFLLTGLVRLPRNSERLLSFVLRKGEFNLPSNVRVLSLGKDRGWKIKATFYFYIFTFYSTKDYDAVFVHMNPIWVVWGAFHGE